MNPTIWTPEQLATLRRLYVTESPQDVAKAIGRPLKSVYHKASALGLKSASHGGNKPGYKPKPTKAMKPCMPVSRPAPAYAKGPAFQPGPPIITAKTRFVVGPSPQRSLRTSTFLE